jgi:hypothetical protein
VWQIRSTAYPHWSHVATALSRPHRVSRRVLWLDILFILLCVAKGLSHTRHVPRRVPEFYNSLLSYYFEKCGCYINTSIMGLDRFFCTRFDPAIDIVELSPEFSLLLLYCLGVLHFLSIPPVVSSKTALQLQHHVLPLIEKSNVTKYLHVFPSPSVEKTHM